MLRQGRYLWYQGFPLPSPFQPYLEAECPSCQGDHGMAVNLNELHTLLGSDFVKEYHPLKEYLDGLPPWDGETDYIDRLAAMVHVKESPHSPLQQDKSRERNDLSETPVVY